MSSREWLTGSMKFWFEGDAVLPAAPDDADPGAGEYAHGMVVSAATLDRSSIYVGCPRVNGARSVGEVHHGEAQLLVARPAEHGQVSLPRLASRWRHTGQRSEC